MVKKREAKVVEEVKLGPQVRFFRGLVGNSKLITVRLKRSKVYNAAGIVMSSVASCAVAEQSGAVALHVFLVDFLSIFLLWSSQLPFSPTSPHF